MNAINATHIEELKESATTGHAAAQFELGEIHDHAQGDKRDALEAATWYKKAAEQGHAEAQFNLAKLCTELNQLSQAELWFKNAAELGHPQAQVSHGRVIYRKKSSHDYKKQAAHWFTLAAEQGDNEAQNKLGIHQCDDTTSDFNPESAVTWFKKAAEQGNPLAQGNLATCHAQGLGVTQDEECAKILHAKAAQLGNENSAHILRQQSKTLTGTIARKPITFFTEEATVTDSQEKKEIHHETHTNKNGSSWTSSSSNNYTTIHYTVNNINKGHVTFPFVFKCRTGDNIEILRAKYDKWDFSHLIGVTNLSNPGHVINIKNICGDFVRPKWGTIVLLWFLISITFNIFDGNDEVLVLLTINTLFFVCFVLAVRKTLLQHKFNRLKKKFVNNVKKINLEAQSSNAM